MFLMRRCCSLAALLLAAACADILADKYPIAYAQVEGTVQRDQPSLDPLELTLGCGRENGIESMSGPVKTNTTGFYRLPAGVVTPVGPLPDSGALYQCQLRATFFGGQLAADTNLVVRFVPQRADVVPLIVHMRVQAGS